MIDWSAVLAALGLSAPVASVLGIGLRFALPSLIHLTRVWMVDRGLRRAAGLMFSLRVASGRLAEPMDPGALVLLVDSGTAYMRNRLSETLDTLGIGTNDLRDMVQAAFGELLAGKAAPAAPVARTPVAA